MAVDVSDTGLGFDQQDDRRAGFGDLASSLGLLGDPLTGAIGAPGSFTGLGGFGPSGGPAMPIDFDPSFQMNIGAPSGPTGMAPDFSTMTPDQYLNYLEGKRQEGLFTGQAAVQARRDAERAALEAAGINTAGLFGPSYRPTPEDPSRAAAMRAAGGAATKSIIQALLQGRFGDAWRMRNELLQNYPIAQNPDFWGIPTVDQTGQPQVRDVSAGLGAGGGVSVPSPGAVQPGVTTPTPTSTSGAPTWLNQLAMLYGYLPSALSPSPTAGPVVSTPPPGMAGISSVGTTPVTDMASGTVATAGGPVPAAGSTDILDQLLQASGSDINYLRGTPYSTTQEQAMREALTANIRNDFDRQRQQLIDTLGARQGFSGVLQDQLAKLDQQEQQALSNVDRDLMIRAADEQRSRLAESRNMLAGLEALQRSRAAEAMGIESALNAEQRQGLMDLLAALGLAPSTAETGGIASNLLNYAGQLGNQALLREQAATGGIGDWASLWSLLNRQTAPTG